jgi:hypothetical protein
MQAKPTLKDLGKTPGHRTYASGPALKVPTRPAVGASSADLRVKRTDRKLTIWASRTAQSECSYPAVPAAPTNIPARLRSKKLEVASRGIGRPEFCSRSSSAMTSVVGPIPRDLRSRLLSIQGVMP